MSISKEILKRCIVEKREEILNLSIVERPVEFEPKGNYVFVGLRRVGKSYMLYQRVRQLLDLGVDINDILFVNFEDERLSEIQTEDLSIILDAHYELKGNSDEKPYVFLDEIQNVMYWDKFVRRLADSKYIVYVTGSNAKMLSTDVATTLGGRFFICDVYPYSLEEYEKALGRTISAQWKYSVSERAMLISDADKYMRYGGLPEVLNYELKRSALESLYQKIYLGDICARNNIRNSKVMGIIIKKLAESVKQPTSYTRIQNIVKSTGNNVTVGTVAEYIGHAIDSWLIVPMENGLAKIGERESVKKYYFLDNGVLNLFLINSDTSLLENMVAVSLVRKYGRGNVVYLKQNLEIDFYVERDNVAIQVAYSIKDYEAREREVNALKQMYKKNRDTRLVIVTKDESEKIVNGDMEIEVISLVEFLLRSI